MMTILLKRIEALEERVKALESKRFTSTKFSPPSLSDVVSYLEDLVLAKKFYCHYESNGWKVGKNSMKSWRAAADQWRAREINQTKTIQDEQRIGRISTAELQSFTKR
jgi:DNA-binding transcriptional regulator GbsR (MarR family)